MKTLFTRIVLFAALGLLLLGCDAPGTAGTPTPSARAPVKEAVTVVAEASVVPVHWVELSLTASGTVAEVVAAEGDQVKAGQLLVRLDNRRLTEAASQAEAALAAAKAAQGRAQATVARYQAALDLLKAGPRAEDVAAARAAVSVAQAELARVQAKADDAQLTVAKVNMDKAARAVQQAQFAYDRVKDAPWGSTGPEALQLEQATLDYQAAKAQYEQLVKGPRDVDVSVAQANVIQAQAALAQAQMPARQENIAAAEADLQAAQADAEAAGADIASAEAALAQARAALTDYELHAPFDGVIVTMNTKVGETVSPAAFVVRMADLGALRIETTDLTELSVSRIRVGDPASLTFDAVPDLTLAGKVERINEFGTNRQGDIVYTVYIVPDTQDSRLHWNMTASATISPQAEQ